MKNTETKETPTTSPGRVPKNSETTKPAAFTACLMIKGKVGSAFKQVPHGWNKEVAARRYSSIKIHILEYFSQTHL